MMNDRGLIPVKPRSFVKWSFGGVDV